MFSNKDKKTRENNNKKKTLLHALALIDSMLMTDIAITVSVHQHMFVRYIRPKRMNLQISEVKKDEVSNENEKSLYDWREGK